RTPRGLDVADGRRRDSRRRSRASRARISRRYRRGAARARPSPRARRRRIRRLPGDTARPEARRVSRRVRVAQGRPRSRLLTETNASMDTFLTGIKTSGTPHIGNYVGAIRPAIESSARRDAQSYFFLADYHALGGRPEEVARSTLEIAATWLALGLDTEHAVFYRQSDVPEITELQWILTCVTAKGLMNRAHAYKA